MPTDIFIWDQMLYPKKKVLLVLTMTCLLTGNAHMANVEYIKLHRCSWALFIYFFVHLHCDCSFNNMQEINSLTSCRHPWQVKKPHS